jgi:uncharacterized protein YbaP (TraB family)
MSAWCAWFFAARPRPRNALEHERRARDTVRRARWPFAAWLTLALFAAAPGCRADDCPPTAQVPSAEQLKAGMAQARDRGFLWRITKGGHSSFLYGTLHVARAEWMFPGATLIKALRDTDVIALELDLLDESIMSRLQRGMAWRPERAVDASLEARLQRQLQAACLPDTLLHGISPEMLATTLAVLAGRRAGLDPAYAIDVVLASLGRELRKPVASLETPEQQLKLLHGRDAAETRAIVEQALDELESGQAQPMLTRIATVWAEGRLDELERYEAWCDCLHTDEDRRLYRRLLDERNPGLAQHIDELHRQGKRVFAAVGSLHMTGPLGVPALLARRGYRVERVAFD